MCQGLSCILLSVGLVLLAAGQVSASSVLIGGLWDLSGGHCREGRAASMAAERAVGLINSQGGIDGRHLELLTKDTRGEPGRLLLEARDLARDRGVMALLGPSSGLLASVLSDYAEAHEIPLVLTAGYRPLICLKKKIPFTGPLVSILISGLQ